MRIVFGTFIWFLRSNLKKCLTQVPESHFGARLHSSLIQKWCWFDSSKISTTEILFDVVIGKAWQLNYNKLVIFTKSFKVCQCLYRIRLNPFMFRGNIKEKCHILNIRSVAFYLNIYYNRKVKLTFYFESVVTTVTAQLEIKAVTLTQLNGDCKNMWVAGFSMWGDENEEIWQTIAL